MSQTATSNIAHQSNFIQNNQQIERAAEDEETKLTNIYLSITLKKNYTFLEK